MNTGPDRKRGMEEERGEEREALGKVETERREDKGERRCSDLRRTTFSLLLQSFFNSQYWQGRELFNR